MERYEKISKIIKYIIYGIFSAVQLIIFIMVLFKINEFASFANGIIYIIGIITALIIISRDEKSSFKISWITFILFLPLVGIISYYIFGYNYISKKDKKKIEDIETKDKYIIKQNQRIVDKINNDDVKKDIELTYNLSNYPVYNNTSTCYFTVGEEMFERMMIDIRNAEKFIFLEYYIIKDGKMFKELFDVLIAKAQEGVEVIIIYDAMGCLTRLPKRVLEAEKYNIKCYAFSPLTFSVYKFLSFRDHRKITIVDGNISYCGGINIGDEYINAEERFGHWKDTALRMEGEATYSFTLMFLKMLDYVSGEEKDVNLYRPSNSSRYSNGLVLPYADGPINSKNPAENLYLKIISSAKEYVYITTPYLDIDYDFLSALKLAARSGVEVIILTPYIPDKKIVQKLTRSFYFELLPSGVKIFEYKPGFIHSKTIVSDNSRAVVGSVNMDFRSLAWNYECAAYICNDISVLEIRDDFLNTLEKSIEIKEDEYFEKNFYEKLSHAFLRLLAPLM